MMKQISVAMCMCLGLVVPTLSWAQHEHPTPTVMTTKMIGTVNFETSCKPAVKDDFNRAVALLHSFWFAESRTMFEEVLKADSSCAIAYWGIGLTHWGNPFGGLRSAQTNRLRRYRQKLTAGSYSIHCGFFRAPRRGISAAPT